MKKWIICLLLALSLFLSFMCSFSRDSGENKKEISFKIIKKEEIPEELRMEIEKKKDQDFYISYQDEKFLYLAKGYEEKEISGYDVKVTDCCETEKFIYFYTDLIGPSRKEEVKNEISHPYIVIRIKKTDKNIIFK